MQRHFARIAAAILAACFLTIGMTFAQTATSEVNGTVTDQSASVVSGATVKLINQGTKLQDQTSTNSTGYFVFVNVRPGTYVLKVEAKGYKTAAVAPFEVQVNTTISQPLKLAIGQITETVEVQAAAPLIEASTTELGTVIDERTVQELPLNGRNFTQLLTLTPGVTPVSTAQNKSVGCCEGNVGLPGSGFSDASFHGQQNRSKLYYYDGIINTNVRGPTYVVIPNADLIQEFKIVGHDAKSEYGGAAGGIVNVVSKAGSEGLHVTAFEFLRNDYFDARDSFVDAKCSPGRCQPGQLFPKAPAPFRQNQFGAVVTGPIIKHKTFFAVGYDGWRYSKADGATSRVPTLAEINGDFTQPGPDGKLPTFYHNIFNPYSTRATGVAPNVTFVRDQFRCDAAGNPLPLVAGQMYQFTPGGAPPAGSVACNKIPQALIFGPMQQFFKTYAATPNFSDPKNPTVNFIRNRPGRNQSDAFSVRIDHRFRDADNVFFRYTEQRNSIFTPIGELGSTQGGSQGRNYGGDWVHAFNPHVILDVRGGVADRPGVDASQQNDDPAGVSGLSQLGFLNTDKYHGILVNVGNLTNGGSGSFGIRGSAPRKNPDWSIAPSLTWLKGNHNIKTGFMYIDTRRIQLNTFQTYTFAPGPTSQLSVSNTGIDMATALLGLSTSSTSQLPVPHGGEVKFKFAGWGAFIQDEWKMRSNVTVTAGLRYDYTTRVQTLDHRLWSFYDLTGQHYLVGSSQLPTCSAAGQAPCIPDAFLSDPHANSLVFMGRSDFAPPPIKDNWGPRLGIAWSATPKTVVRGGIGVYWDSMTARSQWAQNTLEANLWPDAGPFNASADGCTNGNATTPPTCAFGPAIYQGLGGPAMTIIQQQALGFANPLPPYTGVTGNPWNQGGNQNDPNYKDGYATEWNLEVQRELTSKMMVSAAYVGSHSGRLVYSGNANSANVPSMPCANGAPGNLCRLAIDQFRPMPWVTSSATYARSIGYANYNALEARFQNRLSHGLSSLVSYTWSKSLDTSSGYFGSAENGLGGGNGTIQNFFDRKSAYGISSYDITHFLSWSAIYELPFGRGKTWLQSGPLSWILGDWQTSYVLQARSGQPFNIGVSGDFAALGGNFGAPGSYLRPNLVPGADPFKAGPVPANPDPGCATTISQGGKAPDRVQAIANWFNPCAFVTPIGSFGTVGRNAFRGPHVVNMDFGLSKNIHLTERTTLQFRAEAFNVFNIQNWDSPQGGNNTLVINTNGVNSPLLVNSGAGVITQLAQGTTARELQFGLKVTF
ncbi:MAG TPA: carboxypeptidase-like regulatory domain-containing protein [Terriglobales bacterium]|jgi:hypothetical protein|nr:carboxypeptidase-like regulatory domain-containing protein [Terriglobales bacterium]